MLSHAPFSRVMFSNTIIPILEHITIIHRQRHTFSPFSSPHFFAFSFTFRDKTIRPSLQIELWGSILYTRITFSTSLASSKPTSLNWFPVRPSHHIMKKCEKLEIKMIRITHALRTHVFFFLTTTPTRTRWCSIFLLSCFVLFYFTPNVYYPNHICITSSKKLKRENKRNVIKWSSILLLLYTFT